VAIALFALTLPGIRDMDRLISIIMLHDVREDYNVSNQEIVELFVDREFGMKVAFSVENMTKEFRGIRKNDIDVFAALALDEYGSIAKLCDRIHNLATIVGVFTLEKQKEYLKEVVELFLPMLKLAKRRYTHHIQAYENIKHMVQSQMEMIQHIHTALEAK
jgi:(p)ppGpp synthase/HD superfamily hydrolase